MKISKKTARFGVSNSQGTSNREQVTWKCTREIAVEQKPPLKCSS